MQDKEKDGIGKRKKRSYVEWNLGICLKEIGNGKWERWMGKILSKNRNGDLIKEAEENEKYEGWRRRIRKSGRRKEGRERDKKKGLRTKRKKKREEEKRREEDKEAEGRKGGKRKRKEKEKEKKKQREWEGGREKDMKKKGEGEGGGDEWK